LKNSPDRHGSEAEQPADVCFALEYVAGFIAPGRKGVFALPVPPGRTEWEGIGAINLQIVCYGANKKCAGGEKQLSGRDNV
jgi:hypothetical protein